MIFQFSLILDFLPYLNFVFLILGLIIVLRLPFYFLIRRGDRTSFKWVTYSVLIQVGITVFICSPLIILGLLGEFQKGPPNPGLIVAFALLSFFIDLNVVNVIHKNGMKKSVFVALIVVPITIYILYITVPLIIMIQMIS